MNDAEITVAPFEEVPLIPAFCIAGPSVFKFELAVTPRDNVDMFVVMLLINDIVVAQASADDDEVPSNLSLIYRGSIDDVSDVQVIAMTGDDISDPNEIIDAKSLQVGYKLYGPGYTLLDEPDTSCLA